MPNSINAAVRGHLAFASAQAAVRMGAQVVRHGEQPLDCRVRRSSHCAPHSRSCPRGSVFSGAVCRSANLGPNVAQVNVFGRDTSASLSELGGAQPPCKVVSDLTLDKLILTEARGNV
jgi:hypothetical protein